MRRIIYYIYPYFDTFVSLHFLKLIYFNWRIITLQYCDGFLFPFLSKVPSFLLLSFPLCLESFPLPFTNSKSVNKKCYKFSLIQECLYFPFIPEGYFADHGIQVWFFFFFAVLYGLQILIPQQGIEPIPSTVKAWSLNHWTTSDFPDMTILFSHHLKNVLLPSSLCNFWWEIHHHLNQCYSADNAFFSL